MDVLALTEAVGAELGADYDDGAALPEEVASFLESLEKLFPDRTSENPGENKPLDENAKTGQPNEDQ